jgi:hypothetical protein
LNLGGKQGSFEEPPVTGLLMDQAEQRVTIVGADFRKFDRRALLCDNIPNPPLCLDQGQALGRAKAHQDFLTGFQSVSAGKKKPSTAQRIGETVETRFSRRVIHRYPDAEPGVSSWMRFSHLPAKISMAQLN